jgi:hypothetical protein
MLPYFSRCRWSGLIPSLRRRSFQPASWLPEAGSCRPRWQERRRDHEGCPQGVHTPLGVQSVTTDRALRRLAEATASRSAYSWVSHSLPAETPTNSDRKSPYQTSSTGSPRVNRLDRRVPSRRCRTFSSTRRDAWFLAPAMARSLIKSGQSRKAASTTARVASVAKPRPQNGCAIEYPISPTRQLWDRRRLMPPRSERSYSMATRYARVGPKASE